MATAVMETVAMAMYGVWWIGVLCIGGFVIKEAFRSEPPSPMPSH